MATLHITRGLPGSGKTTYALAMKVPAVSRDDIRKMLWRKVFGQPGVDEGLVTAAVDSLVICLLLAGHDVVVHDTNLPDQFVYHWQDLARTLGVDFQIHDLRNVPLEVCLRNNSTRLGTAEWVPVDEIERMYDKYIKPLGI